MDSKQQASGLILSYVYIVRVHMFCLFIEFTYYTQR